MQKEKQMKDAITLVERVNEHGDKMFKNYKKWKTTNIKNKTDSIIKNQGKKNRF